MIVHAELGRRTEFLERELGPCLLVLKCFELTNRPVEQRRSIARQISRGEIERLAEIARRKFGLRATSEQFLRALYALDRAGSRKQALGLLYSLVESVRNTARISDASIDFRLVAGIVITGDQSGVAEQVLPEGSFAKRLAVVARTRKDEELTDACAELGNLIRAQESAGLLEPWQDVWEYVVLLGFQNLRCGADLSP